MWTIATRKDRKGYPEAELLSVYREYGVIRKSDRDDNHNVESDDLSSYKFVRKGDLVLNKMKTWQGSLGVSPYDGIVSPAYFTCELNKNVHGPYIHHLLRSQPYIAMFGAASKGIRVGQWDLPYEEFREIPVLLPPVEEQRWISEYLNENIETMDSLIAARKKQIKSLIEERVSNITRIVSGGFESTSEVGKLNLESWMTELPKSWRLLPLKRAVVCSNSGVWGEEPGSLDIDVRVSTTAHLTRDNQFVFDEMPIRSVSFKDFNNYICKPGDLVVVKSSGSADNVMSGKVSAVHEDAPKFLFSNFLMRLRPHNTSYSTFLQSFLSSNVGVERVKRMVSTTTYPNLKVEEYMNSLVPIPPENELKEVSKELEAINNRYMRQMELLSSSVNLLMEIKSSFIVGAVTGQVRFHRGKEVPK